MNGALKRLSSRAVLEFAEAYHDSRIAPRFEALVPKDTQ